jgi:hypothetical protein
VTYRHYDGYGYRECDEWHAPNYVLGATLVILVVMFAWVLITASGKQSARERAWRAEHCTIAGQTVVREGGGYRTSPSNNPYDILTCDDGITRLVRNYNVRVLP